MRTLARVLSQQYTTMAATNSVSGLDFPSNRVVGGDTFGERAAESVRCVLQGANLFPLYGTNGDGVTIIMRAKPRQQNGFYTFFFYGHFDSFFWDLGNPNSYFGGHPWPPAGGSGTTQRWEISVGGGDFTNANDVIYGPWYTVAFRARAQGSGALNTRTKQHQIFWNMPDMVGDEFVERIEPATYGNTVPTNPAFTIGDAGWNPCKECANGPIRGIQIYNSWLSDTNLPIECANDSVNTPQTAQGQASVWYMNQNPTPTDITDKSGAGHPMTWVNPTKLPALWTP